VLSDGMTGNAYCLPDVDQIGVPDVVVRGQLLPGRTVARGDATQRISPYHHVRLVAARAGGMRKRANYLGAQSTPK